MKPSIPNQRNPKSRAHSRAGGFSLVELLFSLVLLGIVLGVAMEAIIQLQQRNFAETAKVDTVQETRDFVDQMVRDIHDVGYPPGAVKNDNPDCTDKADVACGLIYFTSTEVRYEGDLDGTGTVYRIWVKLEIPPSGKCPCKLERGAITKDLALLGNEPEYFTEVNGVLNSGNGAGAATYPISLPGGGDYTAYGAADIFTAYDVTAAAVAPCLTKPTCSSIYSLQITVNVAPNFTDLKTDIFPVYSVTSKARMNNNWLFN